MAIFSLEIDDADVERVLGAVAANYGWQSQVRNPDDVGGGLDAGGNPVPSDIDNPETKGDFTHRMVREFLANNVTSWETKEAKRLAALSIDTSIGVSEPVE